MSIRTRIKRLEQSQEAASCGDGCPPLRSYTSTTGVMSQVHPNRRIARAAAGRRESSSRAGAFLGAS